MIDITAAPFNLDTEAAEWVQTTLAGMDLRAKVGQLFHLVCRANDAEGIRAVLDVAIPNGFMLRALPAPDVVSVARLVQEAAPIPMLLSADVERGANGLYVGGTSFGSAMQVAATGDVAYAERLGTVIAREAGALGCTWAFSPIVDIQYNFASPITNIRCFGSDRDTVSAMGVAFVKAVESRGMATAPKHFPGDGVDDRDQHLVTSVNRMSVAEWDESFGKVYKDVIDAGARSIMVGHIALPEYSKALRPGIADSDILPASMSEELLSGLLRDRLGFNGVIVSDSLRMVGFTVPMRRSDALPLIVEAGIDVLLFASDFAADMEFVLSGVANGVLSMRRVDEAVTRVLALKASLGLHKKSPAELVPGLEALAELPLDEHRSWSTDTAQHAVTLVKNLEPGVLPLDPSRHKRIVVYYTEDSNPNHHKIAEGAQRASNGHVIAGQLTDAGFDVTVFDREGRATMDDVNAGRDAVPYAKLITDYDLVLYVAQYEPASSSAVVRLQWAPILANDSPKYLNEIPTVFVSLGSPFHLQDVPRVKTFVNAYGYSPGTVDAVVDKLLGRSEFVGTSPVDPFCGYWDTHL
jgi:beta-N-acetylhexosaminidase